MKLDLHVHSFYSKDAGNLPKTIIEKALEKKLDGIAVTDHDSVKAWKELNALGRKAGVKVIQGEELKVYEGKKFVGELMGLFLTEKIKKKNYMEAIEEIRAQGGIVVVPHPFDVFRNNFKKLNEAVKAKKVDAIEAFNSRCYFNSFNEKAERFAEKNSLPKIAGSDAHFPEEIGNAFTEVKADSIEDARRLIRKDHTRISGRKSSFAVHLKTRVRKYNIIKPE
ncbi:MAG: PHP domain-containing protein [Candidatus Diapherotrites archaeon]